MKVIDDKTAFELFHIEIIKHKSYMVDYFKKKNMPMPMALCVASSLVKGLLDYMCDSKELEKSLEVFTKDIQAIIKSKKKEEKIKKKIGG